MSPRNLLVLSNVAALMLVSYFTPGRASAQEAQPRPGIVLAAFQKGQEKPADDHQLGEFLVGTKWLMYEIPGRIVEFGAGGKFDLDDWKMQGIEARWQVTGPKQVTVTVTGTKFHNLTAVLNFDNRLSYFTGTDLDHKRQITKSPRINMVPNDPADPYRH